MRKAVAKSEKKDGFLFARGRLNKVGYVKGLSHDYLVIAENGVKKIAVRLVGEIIRVHQHPVHNDPLGNAKVVGYRERQSSDYNTLWMSEAYFLDLYKTKIANLKTYNVMHKDKMLELLGLV